MEEKTNIVSQRCYKFSCKEKNQQHDQTKTVIFWTESTKFWPT